MSKARINLSLDQDLADFAKMFAAENRITFSEIVSQYLLSLKRRVERESVEKSLPTRLFMRRWKMPRPNFVREERSGIPATTFLVSDACQF